MESDSDRKQSLIERTRNVLRRAWQAVAPGRQAWRGAAWGGTVALLLILVVTAIGLFGRTAPTWFAVGIVLFIAAFALAGGLLTLIWRILKAIPTLYAWVLLSGLLVLVNLVLVALSVSLGIIVVGFATLAMASLVVELPCQPLALLHHRGLLRLQAQLGILTSQRLINEPAILFGDEPTGALNSKAAGAIMDLLADINRSGTTILLVTHNPKVAARTERVLFMLDGRIVSQKQMGKYAGNGNGNRAREEDLSSWLMTMGF